MTDANNNHYDVIVLGGGAAGLMCAITAGNRGHRVLVLEGSNKPGKKILMSGGGRCNFTNLHTTPANYLSANPHFCKSALSRYTPWDFVALVEQHGIAYHEKDPERGTGQLFCDSSSKDILNMLLQECTAAGVEIICDAGITGVNNDDGFTVTTSSGAYMSDKLVLATGGLSIPKMGASDFGYRLARQWGLNVLETSAGLVPFTLTGNLHNMSGTLSGISLPAIASNARASFTDALLFTHRGLSGPAMLQLSSYWQPGETIAIDLLPGVNAAAHLTDSKREQPRSLIRTALAGLLPRALITELQSLHWSAFADTRLAEIPDDTLSDLGDHLNHWSVKPAATEGYRTAEVTLGGIDTNELSSKTMEAHKVPGLYCIGEVVDVTGHLGGYNFQWAWASAVAAGKAI